ncbi:hypothetical protein FB562_2049 [Homoserinimonas aerilata]|uniref:Uncharacterized protein n=1 Tax=Homoserinimonas aerilata TaxID=1162970 RepID=A0A542YEM1_9MICO|nr:hypothetical protein [Homoserinimonas aerilata]TQL46527.1 hypothetical protein FB562_2049 [Homoserinimonas aerilata]
MYSALWRLLPGPLWFRILLAVILVVVVLLALILWVFPWVNTFIGTPEVTVQQ